MATPTPVESLHAANGGSSISVVTGSGTAVGDIIVAVIGCGAATLAGSSAPTSSPSLSWNAVTGANRELSGNGGFMRLYWAEVTTAGAHTITAPSVGGYNTLLAVNVLRSANTSTPMDGTPTFALVDPAVSTPASPSVSPSTSDGLLFCAALSGDAASSTYISQPSGMTDLGSDSQFGTLAMARQTLSSSGATGAKTWSFGQNRRFVTLSFVVQGAAGSPTAPETGVGSLGISGRATATKVVAQTGRCSVGARTGAIACKVVAQTSVEAIGLAGTSSARKIARQSSAGSAGLIGTSATKKIAVGSSAASVGTLGRGSAAKKIAQSGISITGLVGIGPTQGARSQTGRCSLGIAGTVTVKKVVTQSVITSVGLGGRTSAVKRISEVGHAAMSTVGAGATTKKVSASGVTSGGFSATGAQSKRVAVTGRVVLGFAGYKLSSSAGSRAANFIVFFM